MAQIIITEFDKARILQLLTKKKPHDEYDKALSAELDKAKVVEQADIPADCITMNSQIKFEDSDGKERVYWLVFPEDADVLENKISILSPVGCALLGYGVGDTVMVPTPQGSKELTVKEVLSQPEREGNYSL